ncbi:recombinase family protein [Inquilinus sp. CA228]|uniref:recombinase family protein n=1 Tax=Inquilinus sp. CA228 TaxID=3455609 RepID=UPI003F8D04D8
MTAKGTERPPEASQGAVRTEPKAGPEGRCSIVKALVPVRSTAGPQSSARRGVDGFPDRWFAGRVSGHGPVRDGGDRYARVSTADQDPALQFDALAKGGCVRVVQDNASGGEADRPGLTVTLAFVREGSVDAEPPRPRATASDRNRERVGDSGRVASAP